MFFQDGLTGSAWGDWARPTRCQSGLGVVDEWGLCVKMEKDRRNAGEQLPEISDPTKHAPSKCDMAIAQSAI